ncbi:MAG: hypothetical protein Fur0010_06410 [Bdellovibrio sp.]
MKIIISLFLLFSIVACKQQKVAEDTSSTPQYNSWQQPIQAVGRISGEQRVIGQDVCEALREKRYFFSRQVDRSMNFNFEVKKKECNQNGFSTYSSGALLRVGRNGELSFEPSSRSTMIEDIITDTTATIKEACLKLINGEEIDNTWGDSRTRTQLSFKLVNNRAEMQIARFEYRGNGFYPYLIDKAIILRDIDTNRTESIGLAIERNINQRCFSGETYFLSQKMR